MLQFNDFLILLKDYRKAMCFENETAKIDFVSVTDEGLSITLSVISRASNGEEVITPITLRVNNEGEVIAEIYHYSIKAKTLSLLDYVTLVLSNRVNAMLEAIEKAKSEVLGDE